MNKANQYDSHSLHSDIKKATSLSNVFSLRYSEVAFLLAKPIVKLDYSSVKMIGSPFVTTIVCSHCATRLLSGVTNVQPSSPRSMI